GAGKCRLQESGWFRLLSAWWHGPGRGYSGRALPDAVKSDPFALVRPAGLGLPVLLSSPLSGRHYPEQARRRLRGAPATLAILNDGPVHERLDAAVAAGATLLRARWNRTWIDLNRDPAEFDEDAIDGLPMGVRPCRSLPVQAG